MYIILLSIHGLIRGHDLELGRDPDTGGQTLYAVDLAQALAERDDVGQVDPVTRRIVDPSASSDYARLSNPCLKGAYPAHRPRPGGIRREGAAMGPPRRLYGQPGLDTQRGEAGAGPGP
jgi:hypothetical protein